MILYASPPGGGRNRTALAQLGFGLIVSPVTERMAADWRGPVVLDNGAWTARQSGQPFDFAAFADFAARWAGRAAWIVAPDVVGDWQETVRLFGEWAPILRAMGHRVCVAAQDGATAQEVAQLGADAVALGGSTEWKEREIHNPEWRAIADRHVLRVNTRGRLKAAMEAGWQSCDGSGATRFAIHAERMAAWRDSPQQLRMW